MRFDPMRALPPLLQGQVLRRSERREVAIFLRDSKLWVADFIDGDGELVDAVTWFRFHCGDPANAHARRRMVLESAIPLSGDLVARIERLSPPEARRRANALLRLVRFIASRFPRSRLAASLAARRHRRRRRDELPRLRAQHDTADDRVTPGAHVDPPCGIFL